MVIEAMGISEILQREHVEDRGENKAKVKIREKFTVKMWGAEKKSGQGNRILSQVGKRQPREGGVRCQVRRGFKKAEASELRCQREDP